MVILARAAQLRKDLAFVLLQVDCSFSIRAAYPSAASSSLGFLLDGLLPPYTLELAHRDRHADHPERKDLLN